MEEFEKPHQYLSCFKHCSFIPSLWTSGPAFLCPQTSHSGVPCFLPEVEGHHVDRRSSNPLSPQLTLPQATPSLHLRASPSSK